MQSWYSVLRRPTASVWNQGFIVSLEKAQSTPLMSPITTKRTAERHVSSDDEGTLGVSFDRHTHTHTHTHPRARARAHNNTHACTHARTCIMRMYRGHVRMHGVHLYIYIHVPTRRNLKPLDPCHESLQLHAHICIHKYIRLHTHVWQETHIYTVLTYTCMFLTFIHTLRTYIPTYIHTYIHTHIHVYIH